MTDKQIIISDYFTATLILPEKIVEYQLKPCKDNQLVDKINEQNSYLELKEQECERLKKELHKIFEEKDTLHLIIDRLLEASGYDTNTASAEDFEDVYENMRYEQQQLDQLKAENEQLKEELSAIQHNCSREGCKYYDDNTFKVFYECKAQKALQLSANSVTTKYCDLLKTLTEIKDIVQKGFESSQLTKLILDLILQKISECELE